MLTEQEVFNKAGIGQKPAEPDNNTPPAPTATTPQTPAPTVSDPNNGVAPALTTPTSTTPAPATEGGSTPDVTIKFGGGEPTTPSTPAFDAKALFGIDIAPEEAVNRVKSYEALKQENEKLKNPFANQKVKDFNDAISKGINEDIFWQVYNTDPDKLTPTQKAILHKQWSEGISEQTAKIIIEDEFRLNVQETDDMTDDQKAEVKRQKDVGNARLESAAKVADKFLREHRAQALTPPEDTRAQQTEAVQAASTPLVTETLKNYSTLQIGNDIKIETSPEELKAIGEEVMQTLIANSANVNPQSKNFNEMVNAMVKDTLIVRNFERIIQTTSRYYEVKAARDLHNYKHNPSGTGSNADQQQTPPGQQQTLKSQIADMVNRGY